MFVADAGILGLALSTAILIMSLVGGAVSAIGQIQQGRAARAQKRAEAAWHNYNAQIAQRDKIAAKDAADFKAAQHRKQAEALQKRNRALTGASGVNVEGSPLLVAEDNAAQLALEESNIIEAGARDVQTLESRSILDLSKATAARTTGAAAGRAGVIGAGATILQTGASAAFMKHQMDK